MMTPSRGFSLTVTLFGLALIAFSLDATPQEAGSSAKAPVSKLAVRPAVIGFGTLNLNKQTSSTRHFVVVDTGGAPLTVNVPQPSGSGGTAFTDVGGGSLQLQPHGTATVTVIFQPSSAGKFSAIIPITSDASAGRSAATVHLSGVAKGSLPPTPTPTPPGPSPSATPTPSAQPPGTSDKNSANAPGVIISGTTVTAYVPFGSDDNHTRGVAQVVIENASTLPSPAVINTDRVNSCTPANTGEVLCAGQTGSIDLIAPNGSVSIFSSGASNGNAYTGGDCVVCGAEVDNALGLGILSTGNGFVTLALTNNPNNSVSSPVSSNGEPVGVNFGYDPVHRRILSANYKVVNPSTFATSNPHFQIVDISGSSPMFYELNNDQAFFRPGTKCGTANHMIDRDGLPDTTAIDTVSNIAYVTFHTPADCFSNPIEDIALFDMSQATFSGGIWDTPGKSVQTLSGIGLNGIDPISIEANNHVAIVSGGSDAIGALRLPYSSGAGVPMIPDYVGASMPNDPSGVAWLGWHQPDGLATYVSPSTKTPMGVMMNNGMSGGNAIGPTYLAIVDLEKLLTAPRDPSAGNQHKVDTTVDLVKTGVVRFVKVQ